MSKNLNYKQAANVERRTWDKETYEAKAKSRVQAEQNGTQSTLSNHKGGLKRSLLGDDEEALKEEFIPAVAGEAGPESSDRAFLKARQAKVDIDSKIGTTTMMSVEAATSGSVKDGVTKTGVGWHCRVCDCFLKDSHTYLDHINGRKHQKALGYSMRVEENTKDQIQARLAELAKQKETQQVDILETNYENIVQKSDEEALRRKEERARKREERKKKTQQVDVVVDGEAEIDPDMAAMMGFSGFGSR